MIAELTKYMPVVAYLKGATVTDNLKSSQTLYVVKSGMFMLRSQMVVKKDQELAFGLLKLAGDVVGADFIFSPDSKNPTELVALEDGEVFEIKRADLAALLEGPLKKHRAEVIEGLAERLAKHCDDLMSGVIRTTKPGYEAILEVLLDLKEKVGVDGPVGHTLPIPVKALYALCWVPQRTFEDNTRILLRSGQMAKGGRGIWIVPK